MAVTLQTIIHEAHENHLPASVLLTIGEYVPEIGSEIAKYTSEIPDGFSFFGDKEVVKQYLAKGLQTDQHVQKVIDLAKVMIVRRNIGQNAGVSFPIHSQVLALTMEYANNEIVLEVGGGTGEIAAILAHCARKLYYIDMDPQCVEKFKQRRLELSKSVRDKLKLIEGNCAKILEQHPELEGQVGLAHGKDVIHMCTEEELHEFLTSLKRLLKPGGKAIFTANYIIHALPKNSVIQDPECTTFRAMHIYLNTEVGHRFTAMEPCTTDEFSPAQFENVLLAERTKKSKLKTVVYHNALKQVPLAYRAQAKKLTQAFRNENELGRFLFLTTYARLYTQANMARLFEKYGFHVNEAFLLDVFGNVDRNFQTQKGQTVGVVITKIDE